MNEFEVNRLVEDYRQRELALLRRDARKAGIDTTNPTAWAIWLEQPSGEVGPPVRLGSDSTLIRMPLSHRAALAQRCAVYRRTLLGQAPPPAIATSTHGQALELKSAPPRAAHADPETGILTGYLSTFGTVDLSGDFVEHGAYARTLKDAKARGRKFLWPLLWSHKVDAPIGGIFDAVENRKGLLIRAQISGATEDGKRALHGIRDGFVRGLSIGFLPVRQSYRGEIRLLSEIKLIEGSVCVFPAQEEAEVIALDI